MNIANIALQLLATYMLISFFLGLVVMIADTASDYRFQSAPTWVNILYLPPLGLFVVGLIGVLLTAIWN